MADEKKKTLDDILKRISADERRRSRVTAENVKVSKKSKSISIVSGMAIRQAEVWTS